MFECLYGFSSRFFRDFPGFEGFSEEFWWLVCGS